MCRFQAETRVFDWLRSVVAENVISERFRVNRSTSTFHVTVCSMSRFRAEMRVLNFLRSVVAENVIFERFGVMRPRSTF
jgi:hypothetical protein